jgi:holin-like protein
VPSTETPKPTVIVGLLQLVLCQLVGEFIAHAANLPIPGPVIGLVLLFVLLQLRAPRPDSSLVHAADGLLKHLQLLFIPVGVGVIAYWSVLARSWLPVLGGLALGWLAALLAAAAAGVAVLRLEARRERRSTRPAAGPR